MDIEDLITALTNLEVGSEEAIEIEDALNSPVLLPNYDELGNLLRKLVKAEVNDEGS